MIDPVPFEIEPKRQHIRWDSLISPPVNSSADFRIRSTGSGLRGPDRVTEPFEKARARTPSFGSPDIQVPIRVRSKCPEELWPAF